MTPKRFLPYLIRQPCTSHTGLQAVHKPTISSHFWRFFLVFLSFWNVLSPNILMGSSQQKERRKEGREGGKGFPKHRGPQSSLGEACWMERSGTEAAAPGLWTSVKQVDSIGTISDEDACPHVSSWVSNCGCGLVALLCPTLRSLGLQPSRLRCPWGFSRQESWSGLPCPPPGDLPNPGIEAGSPVLHAGSLPSEPPWEAHKKRGLCKYARASISASPGSWEQKGCS